MFEFGLFKSVSYDIPVISIGNITVGGTGKTPHTEYLVRLLGKHYNVAVLSRGYKRETKGFVLANSESGANDIGDEPMQMKRKFPDFTVAVDENRRHGIEMLSGDNISPRTDVVLLDDAYQYRYVKPAISILLIDYNRLILDDYLLPAGLLREPAHQAKRADILIITKCPENLRPIDIRILKNRFKLYPQQTIHLSSIIYGPLKSLSTLKIASDSEISSENSVDESSQLTMEKIRENKIPVLIVAGIATPDQFVNYIHGYCQDASSMIFSDHHYFNRKDVNNIKQRFEKIRPSGGIIITTEKDSMRILNNPLFEGLLQYIFYPELSIRFLENEEEIFNKKILDYVRINKRNS